MVATIHDLLITLAFLAFFRYDMSLNVIAAILTMTGYSTNDTIVIFDRIRENLRGMRRDSLNHVINASINQTLGRTIITSGTALLTALALFFFGGEVLHGFAFTMVVGIITGTYSSVVHRRARSSASGAATRRRAPARTRRRASAAGAAAAAAEAEAAAEGASLVKSEVRSLKYERLLVLLTSQLRTPSCRLFSKRRSWASCRGSPSFCRSRRRRTC